MLLDKSTTSLQIVLAAPKTALDCVFSCVVQDVYRDAMVPGILFIGTTNGVGVVTAVPAPADNTARQIIELMVYNADTAAVTVFVQYHVGAATLITKKTTLNAGQTLTYQADFGWAVN